MSRGRRRGGAAKPTRRDFPLPQGGESRVGDPPLGDAATAQGMQIIESPNVFWECDHEGTPPSARAFEEAVAKALTEGEHCARPLRIQCNGDHDHQPHWRYTPCGTRFADRCEPCSRRYGKQVRALIHAGLSEHETRPALAFTLTAPGRDEFGTVGEDFDHLAAAVWNYHLRDGIKLFTQRLRRAAQADDPEGRAPGYLVIVEFQRRGLAHVHGVVFGAKTKHVLDAAHGPRSRKGTRQVVVTTRAENAGRLVTKTRTSTRKGWSVSRSLVHVDREHADTMWARYCELCFDQAVAGDDANVDFEARHDHLADDILGLTLMDWRWGEQVQIEPFHGAQTGRSRGRWARYLAKYITKGVGHGPTASETEREHHRAMVEASGLLPCHVHGRFQCQCAKHQAMIGQYGHRGNVMVKSGNWGCTLSRVRRVRTLKQARSCTWSVTGAGYPTSIGDEVRRHIARAERDADKRRRVREAVPPTAGPAAP